MISCLLTGYIEDDVLKSTCDFNPERVMNGDVVYEVLKVTQGVPLFLEKHLARFKRSLALTHSTSPSENMIRLSLRTLIESNKLQQGNIRFQVTVSKQNKVYWYCWISPHRYPTQIQYDEGIQTGIFKSERIRPEIKRWNSKFKLEVDTFVKNNHFYEALLVNSKGLITEGSKSNVFFVLRNKLITPEMSTVLPGVTRSVVIDLAETFQIPFAETPVTISMLPQIESAFITGTSPGILPIQSIDDKKLIVNNAIINRLKTGYSNFCMNYMDHFKW